MYLFSILPLDGDLVNGTLHVESNNEYDATGPDTAGTSFIPCSSESVLNKDLKRINLVNNES